MGWAQVLGICLTLVLQLESRPVLGVVAVEIHGGLVGRGEQGAGQFAAAEPAHHAAGLIWAIADFNEVMVGLGGEVQELDVSSWRQHRGSQCPEQHCLLHRTLEPHPARAPWRPPWISSSGRTAKSTIYPKQKAPVTSQLHPMPTVFFFFENKAHLLQF